MAYPHEYHSLLTRSATRGDQQTFLSIAPEYFTSLGEQIIQNLLYQVQRYNSIIKRVWLFGVAFMITVMGTTSIMYQHKPTYIATHMPALLSQHTAILSFGISIVIVLIPISILEMIKMWLYHLIRKTDSIRQSLKRKKVFASDAWGAACDKPDPIPYIEAEAYKRYSTVLKNLARFRH